MASTGQSKGNELLVYVDGTALGYCKDGTLTINGETIDITSKNSAGWKQMLHSLRGFTIEGSGLIVYDTAYGISDLIDLIENKTQVELYLKTGVSGDAAYYGNAYLKAVSEETPNEDASTFTFSFEGDGNLTGGTGFEAEAEAIFSAMGTEPDETRKGVINTLVAAGKTHGWWTKLEWLHVYAAHAADSALLNWLNPGTFDGILSPTAPTFTIDRGYAATLSTHYIRSGFISGTHAASMTATNNGILAGVATDLVDGTKMVGGANDGTYGNQILPKYSAEARAGNFSASGTNAAVAVLGSSIAHMGGFRNGATKEMYVNKTQDQQTDAAGGALVAYETYGLARNSSGSAGNGLVGQLRYLAESQYLTQAEWEYLVDDMEAFLDSIGGGLI